MSQLQRYQNRNGNSGVIAFELRPKAIVVQFQDGFKYEYTEDSAGAGALAQMKLLAKSGKGLSTFISQHVHNAYARKFR